MKWVEIREDTSAANSGMHHDIYEQVFIPPRLDYNQPEIIEEINLHGGINVSLLMRKKDTKPASADIVIGGSIWSTNAMTMGWLVIIDGLSAASPELWQERLHKLKIGKREVDGAEIDFMHPDVAMADLVRLWMAIPNRTNFTSGFAELLRDLANENAHGINKNFGGVYNKEYLHPLVSESVYRHTLKRNLYWGLGSFIRNSTPKELRLLPDWKRLSKWYLNGIMADCFLLDFEDDSTREGILSFTPSRADIFAKAEWNCDPRSLRRMNQVAHVNANQLSDELIEEERKQNVRPHIIEKNLIAKIQTGQFTTLPTSYTRLEEFDDQLTFNVHNQGPHLVENVFGRDGVATSVMFATDGAIYSSYTHNRTLATAAKSVTMIDKTLKSGGACLTKLANLLRPNSKQDDVTVTRISKGSSSS